MHTILSVVHVLVSLILIVVILMQSDKSMNLSGMFGGASKSALGSQPQSVLSKTTTVLAIVFIITSLIFAFYGPQTDNALAPPEGPVGQQNAPQTQQQGEQNPQPQTNQPTPQGEQSTQ